MKVSDYIVEFLINKGISDVFGYPGGMVTQLMDSFEGRKQAIAAHVNYHEQASAFCACGYFQASGIPGVAYATSGPGATNLVTGVCNAYFDSIPVFFITGQVNTFEAKPAGNIRQKGFQETDIVKMVEGCTKYSKYINDKEDIGYCLEEAWYYATEGRPGPVLLDIPMDIQRAEIDAAALKKYERKEDIPCLSFWDKIQNNINQAKRPVLLIGAGIKTAGKEELLIKLVQQWNIPVVSSMLAIDVLGNKKDNYYGFIGAYGNRTANFIVAKSDLLISIGSRLDIRQVGAHRENFAPNAQLIRFDIDEGEFKIKVRDNEIDINSEVTTTLQEFLKHTGQTDRYREWNAVCKAIREKLENEEELKANQFIRELSRQLQDKIIITTDVGQNQVWVAQSFEMKENQKILFSGGHGAMGYSLPAAIGAFYGSRRPVVSINGDGGFQMNMQECQFIAREKLPILIVILNNHALGMIRHFQEMYFESNYYQTVEEKGYAVPDFSRIADLYEFDYRQISNMENMKKFSWTGRKPMLLEICLDEKTYVFPKLEFGKPNQDQEPVINRELYSYLMEL